MPYKSEKMKIADKTLDKRVKLTDLQREQIKDEYSTGLISQRKLAEKYGVSRRTIQFIIDPEKEKIAKEQFKERRKDGRYYDKENHKQYMKKFRDRKQELYKEGKLKN